MPNPENIAGQGFHTNPERINTTGLNRGSKWLSTLLRDELSKEGKALRLVEKLMEKAIDEGDLPAIKEILDRIEGKANQEIKVDGIQSPPAIQIFNQSTPMASSEDKIDV
jgi:hypothetical protein